MGSTADYDAPRRPVIDLEDTATEIEVGRSASQSPTFDLDEPDAVERFEPLGSDPSDEELTATVVPIMSDEFRCSQCFLVHHRSQLAVHRQGADICSECA